MHAHVKSNLRSIRRAIAKTDRKSLSYQWVSPVAELDHEGEDVRDSLAAVAKGKFLPLIETAPLSFEKAPEAFVIDTKGRSLLSFGCTVVVRVS